MYYYPLKIFCNYFSWQFYYHGVLLYISICIFIVSPLFAQFLYRCSSVFISLSFTHVLFLITLAPSVQEAFLMSNFHGCLQRESNWNSTSGSSTSTMLATQLPEVFHTSPNLYCNIGGPQVSLSTYRNKILETKLLKIIIVM